jgi:DNA-directed RNA polymerase subunit M/transcription elongation factor TFIIS
MAAIGSLVFCTDCGNLLEPNTGRKTYIACDVCGTQNKGKYFANRSIEALSHILTIVRHILQRRSNNL